jgi:hypothetical protein
MEKLIPIGRIFFSIALIGLGVEHVIKAKPTSQHRSIAASRVLRILFFSRAKALVRIRHGRPSRSRKKLR